MAGIDPKKLKLQEKLGAKKSTIGIDIGTSSINVAQIAKYKGKQTLIKTTVVEIKEGPKEDRDYATLRSLNEALSEFNIHKAKIRCVVNCPQTCVRKIITPYMPQEDLKGAVSFEAKRSIPFSLNEAVLDFNIIEEVVDKGVEKLSILVAASPKQTIERIFSLFSKKKVKPFAGSISKKFEDEEKVTPLGIKVSGMLPLALCLENIIELSKVRTRETLVTMEMGTLVTELNIYKNSRLQFSRKIPYSGNDLTKSLMGALMTESGKVELTLEEAERVKREYGIPKVEDNKLIDGKITTNHVLSLLRPKVEQLINEIERSFNFYREEMHGGDLDRIVLFGGGAQLKGLPEFLSQELGLEVTIGNPLSDIDVLFEEVVKNEDHAHKLVLAIGAALSSARGINLVPKAMKEKTKRSFQKALTIIGAGSIILTLLTSYVFLSMRLRNDEEKYLATVSKYKNYIPQLQGLQDHILIDQIMLNRLSWSGVLKDISNTIPPNMYLTSLKIEGKTMSLEGVIINKNQPPEPILSEFTINLEKGILKSVKLIRAVKDSASSATEFTLQGDAK